MKRGKRQGKIMALLLCGALVFSNLASSAVLAEDEPAGEAVQEEQVQEVHTHVEEPAPEPAVEVPAPAPAVEETAPAPTPAVEESESAPTSEPVPEPESEEVTPVPETEEAEDTVNDTAEAEAESAEEKSALAPEEVSETEAEKEELILPEKVSLAAGNLQSGIKRIAFPKEASVEKPVIRVIPEVDGHMTVYSSSYYCCEPPTVTITGTELTSVRIGDINVESSSLTGGTYSQKLSGPDGTKIDITASNAGGEVSCTIHIMHMMGGRQDDVVPATCTEDEKVVQYYICQTCGSNYYHRIVSREGTALQHDYQEQKQEVCGQNEEVTIKVCSRCGDIENDTYTSAQEHQWISKSSEAGCVNAGATWQECEKCHIKKDYQEDASKPALGHMFTRSPWKVVVEATCESVEEGGHAGREERACARPGCEAVQTQIIRTGHIWGTETVVVKEATCSEEGDYGNKCTRTDCTAVRVTKKGAIPKRGHDYSGGDSDCTTGVQCKWCGEIVKQSAHTLVWEYDGQGNHWQRCTNTGCTHTERRESHSSGNVRDCTKDWICAYCGYRTKASFSEHTYVWKHDDTGTLHWQECSHDGCEVQTAKSAHNPDKPSVHDCTQMVVCKDCGVTLQSEQVHRYGDWIRTTTNHYKRCLNPGCQQITEKADHTYTKETGDCTKAMHCEICGEIALHGTSGHNFSGSPYYPTASGDGHVQRCINEGCKVESKTVQEHTGGIATCVRQAECEACHILYGTIDPNHHGGSLVTENYRAATENEKGYTGDLVCDACNMIVEEGHETPTLRELHELEGKHEYVRKYDDKESWYECKVCGTRDPGRDHIPHTLKPAHNETEHWQVCESCEYQTNHKPHEENEGAFDHNCTTEVKCKGCGYVMQESSGGHNFGGVYGSGSDGHYQACQNSDCQVMSQPEDHRGEDDGDCTTAVLCKVCNYEIKAAEEHVPSAVWEVDENSHYHSCVNAGCTKKLSESRHQAEPDDKLCTTPTICMVCHYEMAGAAKEHDLSGGWITSKTGHRKKCQTEGCEYEESEVPHEGGTATCKDPAVCSICEVGYGEVNLDNHTGETEIRNHQNPTVTEEGYSGDTYCLDCGKPIKAGVVLDPIAPDHEHIYDETSQHYDSVNHWYECVECGTWIEEEPHSLTGVYDGEKGHRLVCEGCDYRRRDTEPHKGGKATCKDKALCEVCGGAYGDLDPGNHTGSTEVRGAKAATGTTAGYSGDTYCLDCGTLIRKGEIIAAFGKKGGNNANKTDLGEKNANPDKSSPKTGDNNDVMTLLLIALISATCIVAVMFRRRRAGFGGR